MGTFVVQVTEAEVSPISETVSPLTRMFTLTTVIGQEKGTVRGAETVFPDTGSCWAAVVMLEPPAPVWTFPERS